MKIRYMNKSNIVYIDQTEKLLNKNVHTFDFDNKTSLDKQQQKTDTININTDALQFSFC